jgi:hypothetical protein
VQVDAPGTTRVAWFSAGLRKGGAFARCRLHRRALLVELKVDEGVAIIDLDFEEPKKPEISVPALSLRGLVSNAVMS